MHQTLVIFGLFVFLCCHIDAYDEQLYGCTAWGDPHVTRFPLNRTDYPREVWCQESGLVSLLKNKYVQASMWITENPYILTEFDFVFFDDNGVPLCVVNGNQFLSPAAECGQDITITKNGNYITIDYRKVDIIVELRKTNWYYRNWDHFYSIWIWQSSCLIKMSSGLCKTSCDPNTGKALVRQRRQVSTNNGLNSNQSSIKANAANICQTYITNFLTGFRNISNGGSSSQQTTMNMQNAYNACVTDIQITGDLQFGKVSIEVLAINSVTMNISSADNFQEAFKQSLQQTITLVNKTNTQSDTQIIQMINSTISPSINYTVEYGEGQNVVITCLNSSSTIIKIISALYEAVASSCSWDATQRVKELCNQYTRLCQFNADNNVLQNDPCYRQVKRLKVIFQCS